jgi:hypothetical protein
MVIAPVNRLYRFPHLVTPETAGNLRAPNKINRYSIGDRTRGLVYNEDGSLTIYLQHEEAATGLNWMPTPAGNFMAIMRLYEPSEAALSNEYLLPRIKQVKD